MNHPLSLTLCAVALVACGATSTPNGAPSSDAVASASAAPIASSSPSASASAAPSAPPTHLVFALSVRAAKEDRTVGASLEVPTSWSIEDNENLGVELQTCSSGADVLGTSVMLRASACEDGEQGDACVKRIIRDASDSMTTTSDAGRDPLRRWVERSSAGKSSALTYEGKLYAYDAADHAVVSCGYTFSFESERRRAAYAKVCETLAFEKPTGKPGAFPKRAATADADLGNAPDVSHGDAMSTAALGFFDALSKHDVAAASAFIVGPEDCEALVPKAKVAACKTQMTKTEFEKNFDTIAKGFPPFESAGATLLMPMGAGDRKPQPGKPDIDMYIAYVLDKAKPCEASTVGFPVAMIGDRAKVLILTKAKAKE